MNAYHKRLFLLVHLCTLLGCGSFDSSTSVGDDIVADVDGRFADIQSNFRVFSDSIPVVDARSFLLHPDTLEAGLHKPVTVLPVGRFNAEESYAYLEFATDTLFSDTYLSLRRNLDSIVTVTLALEYDSSYPVPESGIEIFAVEPKAGNSRLDTSAFAAADTVTRESIGSLFGDSAAAAVTAGSGIDSILQATLRRTSDNPPYDTLAFAVRLTEGVLRLKLRHSSLGEILPRLKIQYRRMNVEADTLYTEHFVCTHADYSVYEDTVRADTVPVSSWASGRIAVTALDLSSFWDAFDSSRWQIPYTTVFNDTISITVASNAIESDDTLEVAYCLLDAMVTGFERIDTLLRFSGSRRGGTAGDGTVRFSLDRYLDELKNSGKPDTAYLYLALSPRTSNSRLLWGEVEWELAPAGNVFLRAIFTNPDWDE